MRTGGIFLSLVGGVLVLIGFIWGWVVGFYPSELPAIVVLLLIGGGLLWAGTKLIADAPDLPANHRPPVAPSTHWLAPLGSGPTSAPSDAPEAPIAPVAPSTHWLAPLGSGPTSAPSDAPDAEIDSAASAERLAELAATSPGLWTQIELHPNVYPALIEWINAERNSRRP